MKDKMPQSPKAKLRQKAEELLNNKPSAATTPLSNVETLKLVHELDVHQIELEMQNEELTLAKDKAEIAAEKYINLYNFAPSGYFTLSKEGEIMELNFKGANLLGKDRSVLINSKLGFFVSNETRPLFNHFLEKIFKNKIKESCEISLSIIPNVPTHVYLSGTILEDENLCLVTMLDISSRKKAEEKTKKSEEKYRTLFDENKDSITIFRIESDNTPSNFIEANTATTNLFGFTRKELLSISIRDLEKLSEGKRKKRMEALQSQGKIDFETIIKNKKGNLRNVEIESVLISYDNEPAVMNITRDITERKQMENNIKKAHENLETILETIPDLLFEVDMKGRIYHCQSHTDDLLAVPPKEFMGKLFQEVLPADVSNVCFEAIYEANEKGRSVGRQYSLDLPQGKFWFELSVSPIKGDINKDRHFILLARNITNRKESEESLRESEAKLSKLFNVVNSGIVVTNSKGKFINFNDKWVKMLGYTREEMNSMSIFDIIHPNEAESAIKSIAEISISNQEIPLYERLYLKKDKTLFWGEVSLSKMENPDNDTFNIIAVVTDITERKKDEEALQKSQEKLRGIFDLANSGIILTDINGKYLMFNNWCNEMLGYTRKEMNKLSSKDLTHPDDFKKAEILFNKIIEGKIDRYQLEKRFIRKDKTFFWGEISVSAIKDKNGKTVNTVGIITDITERKNNEEKLKQSEARLIAAQAVAKVGSWETDLSFSNIIWSKETHLIFGLDPDNFQLTLQGFLALVHPEDRVLVEKTFIHSIKTNTVNSFEHRIITAAGIEKIAEQRWEILHDDQGQPYKAVGTCQDITERKLAEEKLIEKEYRLQAILSAEPECVKIVDACGNLKSMNPAGLKMIEANSLNQVMGRPIINLIAPEYRESFTEMHHKVLKGESTRMEFEIIGLKDRRRWVETSAIPFQDNGETVQLAVTRDITDRKLAEEQLRESKNILRAVLDNVPLGIWMMNKEGQMMFVNKVFCDSIGITEEQFKSVPHYAQLYTPEAAAACMKSDEKAINGNDFFLSSEKLTFTDGKIHNVEIIKKKIIGVHNDDFSLIGIMQDITERKIAEETLRESEEKYRGLVEGSPDGIVIYADEKIAYINDEGLNMLAAKNRNEVIGKPVFQFVHPESQTSIIQRMKDVISDNFASATVEEKFVDLNGNTIDVEIKAIPTVYEHKAAVQVIVHDITERKRTQEKIRQLSQAVEQSPVSIIITNTKGEIEYANPKFTEATGYSLDEITGKNSRLLKSGYTSLEEYKELWQTISAGKEWHGEFRNKRKNGELFWESATISPIVNLQGKTTHFIAIKEDITNRKASEQELVKAKERAEESDRLKLVFLANMSHEIRTPMNGILGFTELLKEPHLSGEEQQEYIRIIEKSGSRMLNIINDIISISKVESGQIEVSLSETNINGQIEYVNNFFKPEAKQKGIEILVTKQLSPEDAIILTDREKVYAILTNLVKNAIKFTHSGSIVFGCVRKGKNLEFFVKDTGLGISKSQQKIIFERFRQADETLTRTHEGSGLGLAISKSYTEMLGGKIWVESEVGNGSTFYFTIPFNTEHKQEEKIDDKNVATVEKEENKIKDLKVLIVEDDAISKLLITIAVKPYSKEILKASTGGEAVEACRNNPDIDLIMMDINMPIMGGYEATKQIREFNKDIIIIAQTANGMQSDREEAIASGCNDYIAKPVNIAALSELIQKYFKN